MDRCVVRGRLTALLSLLAGVGVALGVNPPVQVPSARVTRIVQLDRLASAEAPASYSIRLEGDIWWASRAEDRFVLQDDSGAAEIEMELPGPRPRAGERVRVEGNGTIARIGACFRQSSAARAPHDRVSTGVFAIKSS